MSRTFWRWTILGTALFVAGPVAGMLTGLNRGPDGGPGASVLVSEAPVRAAALTVGAIVIAAAVGVLGGRLVSVRTGLFCAGMTLAWAAWHSGRLDDVLRTAQSVRPLWALSIEAAALAVLGIAMAWGIERAGRSGRAPSRGHRPGVLDLAKPMVLCIMVGGVAAWGVARSEMVGQTVAAATAAGVFGGLVARLATPNLPYAALVGSALLLAIAGPASAGLIDGDQVVRRLYDGTLFALARPMPIDWLAGLFIGVPMGSSWAASMLEKKQPAPAPRA